MITEVVKAWEEHKSELRDAIKNTVNDDFSYESLVEMIKKIILTKILCPYGENHYEGKITVIDDGDYQGTQIFLIPVETYQPDETEYIVTYTGYGSCSGCDTLQDIISYRDGKPDDEQIKDLMGLCLNLVQRMKWLYTKEETFIL